MINPESIIKVENIYQPNGKTYIDIPNVENFDEMEYDLLNEKDFNKYIKDIESIIRTSLEYRDMIQYLRNDEGMNRCSILTNVSNENSTKIKIHIHHAIFTLYDIVTTVFKKRQMNHEATDPESVAEEVMYLHYIGWVGLMPLCETIHKMTHNMYLFLPTDRVRGNYKAFVNAYYNYIDPELLDYLDCAEQATLDGKLVQEQMKILNRHDVYINANNCYDALTRSDIVNIIKRRIDIIKNGPTKMVSWVH